MALHAGDSVALEADSPQPASEERAWPAPWLDVPPRIVVVGTSAAGKSTLAAELAMLLGVARVELDALFWGPGWQARPHDEFLRLVDAATRGAAWVADGNYGSVRAHLWPRATTVLWLNYGLPVVLWRGLRRTLLRVFTQQELWHGNRESAARAFFSRDSILWWILGTHGRRKQELAALRAERRFAVDWIEFRHPREAAAWLCSLRDRMHAQGRHAG
jgi:adenylate kinase family enzyme